MNQETIARTVRDYLVERLLSGDPRGLEDDTDLQETGLLDSFAVMELTAFLEDELNIRIPADKVHAETFRSVTTIVQMATAVANGRHDG